MNLKDLYKSTQNKLGLKKPSYPIPGVYKINSTFEYSNEGKIFTYAKCSWKPFNQAEFETEFEVTISLDLLFSFSAKGPINFFKDFIPHLQGFTIQVEQVEMVISKAGKPYPVVQWNFSNGSADNLPEKIHPSELAKSSTDVQTDDSSVTTTDFNCPKLIQAGFDLMKSGNWDKDALQQEQLQGELELIELAEILNADEPVYDENELDQDESEDSSEED